MISHEAMRLVREELARAQAKHRAFASGHEAYAVIREELDELWDAIKTQKSYDRYGGSAGAEAVQVAAMALRFLVELCDDDVADFIAGRERTKAVYRA